MTKKYNKYKIMVSYSFEFELYEDESIEDCLEELKTDISDNAAYDPENLKLKEARI